MLVVERRRENLQLIGAIAMLREEVGENADRLERGGNVRDLTLGMWEHCKPTLVGIGQRAINGQLSTDLHSAYREIYEAKTCRASNNPSLKSQDLTNLSTRLTIASKAFQRERRSPRYWLRPERNLRT